ncbi:MAG TPA: autotransporter-associated beta strand repeat-containing protein, partial [Chthoniobacteraceae bacterium]|nr:autotransporter-associated beta strand repeat-containing protein [Chthoniobacteraceae bacterium]
MTWDPIADGDAAIGGTGVWNTSSLFWDPTATDLVAGDHVAWPNNVNSVAVFGGTPGTVTITTGTGVSANGLNFNVSGYVIGSAVAADTLNLVGATPTITVTNAGTTARINSIMTGGAGLVAGGAGNLVLAGANTFTGQTTVNSGTTLSLANAAALGASGVGNETIVNAGGTVNIGGQTLLNERFNIAGTGVGGAGAIVNQGASNATNPSFTLGLTADATISAGGNIPVSYNASGAIVTGAGGRIDVRLAAAAAAGSGTLNLGGFTLTKTGQHLLAIVNHDVSPGNIVINEGQLNFETGASVQGAGTITVNPNGKLGFWQSANGAVTRQIVVNGGTIGDPTSTGASQTISAPITLTGAGNPNFVATANTTTLSGLINEDGGSTITEVAKRGGATLALSNQANSFDAPITVYAGNLQGNYTTPFASGVAPAAPVALTGTPLGTASTITVAGGTLNIRVDGAGDATNQVFTIGKSLVVDRAPSGINLDRLSGTGGTDKNLAIAVTFAPASAANGYSVGQNQLSGAQGNGFRTQFTSLTMNNDTVLNAGDFTFTGNSVSANKNSLIRVGGNSFGFVGGTHDFNALFHLGSGQLRIGSMFGTGVTSDTVTAGSGTIYTGPN